FWRQVVTQILPFLPFLLSKLALYYILCITGALLAGEKKQAVQSRGPDAKKQSPALSNVSFIYSKINTSYQARDKAIKRTGYFRACPEKLLRYEV
uniref:hypothetical protein n=2 Tax=Emergencia timonensis TaxID=1776384 RepID=UPI0039F4CB0E